MRIYNKPSGAIKVSSNRTSLLLVYYIKRVFCNFPLKSVKLSIYHDVTFESSHYFYFQQCDNHTIGIFLNDTHKAANTFTYFELLYQMYARDRLHIPPKYIFMYYVPTPMYNIIYNLRTVYIRIVCTVLS